MRTTLALGLLAMAIAFAAGCSDDSESNGAAGSDGASGAAGSAGGDAGPAFDPAATCKAEFDRKVKCGDTPGDESAYINACKARIACWSTLMVADYINAYFPCAVARECQTSDDDCGGPVYEQQLALPDVKAAFDACMARQDACCDDGGECAFADDLCGLLLITQAGPRAEMAACVAKTACDETASCLDAFLAKYPDCE